MAASNDFVWTRFCLDNGADPNSNLVDEHKTVLAAIAESASVEMAGLLLDHRVQLKGCGAFALAAQEGKNEMVEFLLNRGADVDETGVKHPTDPRYDEDVGSALHKAAGEGNEELVSLLMARGAKLDLKDAREDAPGPRSHAR